MNRIVKQLVLVGVAVGIAACAVPVLGQPSMHRGGVESGAAAQGVSAAGDASIADEGALGPFDVVWDGGGADERWETPENWSTDAVPTWFDSVLFDGTSSKGCIVNEPVELFNFTMTAGYAGTLYLNVYDGFAINGDLLVEGGTLNWGFGWRYCRGDFTRTGGTMDSSGALLRLEGQSPQVMRTGPGGIAVRYLWLSAAQLDLIGEVAVLDYFLVNGASTFSVLDGSTVDARLADNYHNSGIVNQVGSGTVLRTSGGIGITDPAGAVPVPKIDLGQPIYVMLFDDDENTNGSALETTLVSLTNMQNGDVEWLTLTETGNYTGVFRDAAGLPTAQAPPVSGNGVIEAVLGNVIMLRYQDSEDPTDIAVAFRVVYVLDCNGNGIDDLEDIANGTSEDCDQNGMPDECQLPPIGDGPDCNNDGIPDLCQLDQDCDQNGVPDECQVPPIGDGPDCNNDGIPDVCQLEGNDANHNGIPDDCENLGDSDGDGVPDPLDDCPASDLQPTIVIDGCDSGVVNMLFENGCTMLDLIMQCAADAGNHGQFVSCVAHLTNEWKKAGLITGAEKGRIQSCAAQADLP